MAYIQAGGGTVADAKPAYEFAESENKSRAVRRAIELATGPAGLAMTSVLVIDNYDSFTYNLVQYLGELGADVEVVRNDQATIDELLAKRPDRVVVSPGPCTPNEAGISLEVVRRFPEAGIPLLGVCLGHQSLAQAFGGSVVRHKPVHGKTTEITHDGRSIYAGLPEKITVGRYHSLVVDEDALPDGIRGHVARRRGRHGHQTPQPSRRRCAISPRIGADRRRACHAAHVPRR